MLIKEKQILFLCFSLSLNNVVVEGGEEWKRSYILFVYKKNWGREERGVTINQQKSLSLSLKLVERGKWRGEVTAINKSLLLKRVDSAY